MNRSWKATEKVSKSQEMSQWNYIMRAKIKKSRISWKGESRSEALFPRFAC